ncbi:MAG: glycoside hydrolase family 3 protein, partial [Lentisphaeria bacterium]|nr:glycoside hydrolase family 3 protein [Lentisphaeria bacterium]
MEKQIESILSRLTLEEKIILCGGASTMKTAAIERLGIGEMEMSDGPNGVRSTGQPNGEKTTALPAGIALAASFDTGLAEKYGKTIGLDSRALNITSSLGPGINLMRTPLCGRNFEYYGEDPYLAGKIAAGYIRGCQQEKVAATPKHLALNNQEICRTTGSSDIDER